MDDQEVASKIGCFPERKRMLHAQTKHGCFSSVCRRTHGSKVKKHAIHDERGIPTFISHEGGATNVEMDFETFSIEPNDIEVTIKSYC
jgi:hypothetical protein